MGIMNAQRLCIFDDRRGQFGPMTDLRPAFELLTGACRGHQRIQRSLSLELTDVLLASRLSALYAVRYPTLASNAPHRWGDDQVLLINGRWTGGPLLSADRVRALPLNHALVQDDGQLLAAHLPGPTAAALAAAILAGDAPRAALPARIAIDPSVAANVLIERPWHILDQLEATLAADLASIAPRRAPSARVHPSAVLDESQGPVVIGPHAVVNPLAVLIGPCFIGDYSTVQPHALIRPFTVVGHHCKVAGEISASILDALSNKAHLGYLGNALLGQWCNLGADTNVSNLKNTYGPVRVQLEQHGDSQDTGRIFQGPILGDFVRTAIGTRILTGSVIGTAAMIALSTYPPKYVPALAFLTDEGCSPTRLDALYQTITAMFARRQMPLTDELKHVLAGLAPTSP
jgi:UDP-N-acetylglucosamine diphosphorylase/glucosamine-1-phosphate N-acetyltransferase